MLIICPNCGTSYMIEQAALGAAGRTVRCARCKTSWFAGGPESQPERKSRAEAVLAAAAPQTTPATHGETPPASAAEPAQSPAAAAPSETTEPAESVATVESKSPPVEPTADAATPPPVIEAPAEPPADPPAAAPVPALIDDAPSLVPAIVHEPLPDTAEEAPNPDEPGGFDARRRWLQARRKQSRRSSRWTAVILVLVAFNVAVIGSRNEVVRYLPQTASLFSAIGLPVNLRDLKFEHVKLSSESKGGVDILTVQGEIVSEAGKSVAVPRLHFGLRNASGQEVYSWTMAPPRSNLDPGGRLTFRSQIPTPQVDASDVMVRFLTARESGAK